MNDELLALSGSLLPKGLRRIPLRGFDAENYFYALFELDAKWVVNLDEDAFLWNFDQVLSLLRFMDEHGYACAGMPDGGVFPDRFHNPVAMNAFFNVLNIAKLKEKFSIADVRATAFDERMRLYTPESILRHAGFAYDEFEVYYRFFFWMLDQRYRLLYLDALPWARDPVSTMLLDHRGAPMLLHLWYARDFARQRARFVHAHNYCRQLQQGLLAKTLGGVWTPS